MLQLMHTAYSRFQRMSLFARINLAIVLVMTAMLVIMILLLTTVTIEPSLQKDQLLNEEANVKLYNIVSTKYNLVYNQSNLLLSSGHIGEKLDAANITPGYLYEYENTKFIINYLNVLLYSDDDILDAAILPLNENGNFARSSAKGRTVATGYSYTTMPEIEALLAQDSNILACYDAQPPYINDTSQPVITFLAKIYSPILLPKKNPIGVLMVNYPVSVFADAYQQLGALSGGEVYVINNNDTVIFSNNEDALGIQFDAAAVNKRAECSRHPVGISGISVVGAIPRDLLRAATTKLLFPVVGVLATTIGVMLLVVLVLNHQYQKKLNLLADAMEQAAEHDLHVRLPVKHMDEIGRLSMHFNRMCENLDSYIQLHYKAEAARRTAELNALQAQINPHFLFNTIESIRMYAVESSDLNVANMLMKLGNLFRWMILMDQRIVYLEDEVEYNESYLDLQKLRYEDNFETEITISSEALYLGVPKFTIQPIVENAIQHGLKENGFAGYISISANVSDGILRIAVTDNGGGMSTNQLERLLRHIQGQSADPQFGIGIRNVHSRIRMLFGEAYGVEISSILRQGTTVTISLPAIPKKEMERYVSNDHRG